MEVRELAVEELPEAWQLGRLAFGMGRNDPAPAWALEARAEVTRYGAFDPAGRLICKANDLHHEQWWAGGILSAADVGGLPSDLLATGQLYTALARTRNGMLSRGGSLFASPGDRFPEEVDGITMVEDGTRLVGARGDRPSRRPSLAGAVDGYPTARATRLLLTLAKDPVAGRTMCEAPVLLKKSRLRGGRRVCAAGYVEDSSPVTAKAPIGSLVEASADLGVEALTLPFLHSDVPGERVQQS